MNIGEAAVRSGLSAKTIRYYEGVGLIDAPNRTASGYRDFETRDIHILRFVHRARGLGFSVVECRDLLALYRDRNRASADVKAIALRRVADIDRKIEELHSLRANLSDLAKKCHGDDRPDCPILDDLSGVER
ncbi:MAG: Cu(I)-responsive transcriptional regulator [Alphaproteobacteria bacterium]|nr:Cu(I)-responsive transcriptional regulator [Alphaproteobacteria bacterium]